ncbi:MAG TPA: hypothetical protein VKI00_03005 [Mycobacterium sp.]|uniref:hypothetical protein n=1 Tax=Mycobacterium sp. TaxID=1785 RepID=UPI002C48BEBB|nr:hypothetical protein [Mycobacterium sp.]HME74641.1 hypothetical protein [Mycobacterium sp.]
MTDTTTEVQDSNAVESIGTLEHLDPALLEIGENVRDDAALSKSFIASIAENGVLVPITGVRDPENAGIVRVRNGQRRPARAIALPAATQ